MKFSFNNILVPVDFTINTEVALTKALAVADTKETAINLLHVRKSTFTRLDKRSSHEDAAQLEQWKEAAEEQHPGLSVQWWIAPSFSVEPCIIQTATMLRSDLIVIGKSKKNHWTNFLGTVIPTRIACKTGIPVLTVRPGSLQTRVRTIVVPVTEAVPLSKMAALSFLCTRLHPTIHLVAFGNSTAVNMECAGSLLQLYKWIKAHLRCAVEYALLEGSSKSKALLAYTEKVNADLLLVYPEQETKIDIWNRHISDVLPAHSKVQVLAVQPEFTTI